MVIESLGGEYQVAGSRDIDTLHALLLADIGSVIQFVRMVNKGIVAGSEVHGRSQTESKVLADARLAQYANGETCVPVVLVSSDEFSHFRAIIIFDDLWTYVI